MRSAEYANRGGEDVPPNKRIGGKADRQSDRASADVTMTCSDAASCGRDSDAAGGFARFCCCGRGAILQHAIDADERGQSGVTALQHAIWTPAESL